MKKKNKNVLTHKLLIILAVLVVATIGLIIYGSLTKQSFFDILPEKLKNTNPTVVSKLSAQEKNIGTIIYSAAKVVSDIKNTNNKYVTELETTDSRDGAVNIYAQDLLNRYPEFTITKETNSYSDAADNKSVVLRCKGNSGSITITIWSKSNGKTAIKIEKDINFQ